MIIYTQNGLPPKAPDGTIDHRRRFDAHEVTKETRTHWHVGRFRVHKISKATLLSNEGDYGTRRWYTAEQVDDLVYVRTHRARVKAVVEQADVALLRRLVEVVDAHTAAPTVRSDEATTDSATPRDYAS